MRQSFSKIGFILAVAGSAVGLGNAWKFPTMVGQNGGSAFVLLFVAFTLAVGFVIFLCELYIGRASRLDPNGAYYTLAPRHKRAWSLVGFTMIGALLIVSFYSVIIGWIVYYIYHSLTSLFTGVPFSTDIAGNEALFTGLLSKNFAAQQACFTAVFAVAIITVARGVKAGIERLNIVMMPALFLMLCALLGYAAAQEGFGAAAGFLFRPDFSAITPGAALSALGLACFSLSIGAGSIITYSASLPERTNFITSTIYIIVINLIIGLMMGLVVFSFVFTGASGAAAADIAAQSGPGLIFISLMSLFAKLGTLGQVLSLAFFIALFFAGITSAVSMIEPFVFYLINRFKFSRARALVIVGAAVYLLGTACAASSVEGLADALKIGGMSVFDLLDYASSNIIMPFGSFMAAIFVGWVLPRAPIEAIFRPYMSAAVFALWLFFARFIAPLAVLAVAYIQIKGA